LRHRFKWSIRKNVCLVNISCVFSRCELIFFYNQVLTHFAANQIFMTIGLQDRLSYARIDKVKIMTRFEVNMRRVVCDTIENKGNDSHKCKWSWSNNTPDFFCLVFFDSFNKYSRNNFKIISSLFYWFRFNNCPFFSINYTELYGFSDRINKKSKHNIGIKIMFNDTKAPRVHVEPRHVAKHRCPL